MTPDPTRQDLAGRIIEAFDLVQVVVVEAKTERLARFPDVCEIDDPAELGVLLALDANPNPIRVAMQALALVAVGQIRKQVRGLETELFPDLHRSGILRILATRRQLNATQQEKGPVHQDSRMLVRAQFLAGGCALR